MKYIYNCFMQNIHNCLIGDIKKKNSRRPLPYPIYSMDGNISHKVSNLRQFISNCAASVLKHSFVNLL